MNSFQTNAPFKTRDDHNQPLPDPMFGGNSSPCRRVWDGTVGTGPIDDNRLLRRPKISSGPPQGDATAQAWKSFKAEKSHTWKLAATLPFDESMGSAATKALETSLRRESNAPGAKRSRSFGLLDDIEIEDSLTLELGKKLSTVDGNEPGQIRATWSCDQMEPGGDSFPLRRVRRCRNMYKRQLSM